MLSLISVNRSAWSL